jgi:hypothetical protein
MYVVGMAKPVYMTRPRMMTAAGVKAWTSVREVAATVRKNMDIMSVAKKLIR